MVEGMIPRASADPVLQEQAPLLQKWDSKRSLNPSILVYSVSPIHFGTNLDGSSSWLKAASRGARRLYPGILKEAS